MVTGSSKGMMQSEGVSLLDLSLFTCFLPSYTLYENALLVKGNDRIITE